MGIIPGLLKEADKRRGQWRCWAAGVLHCAQSRDGAAGGQGSCGAGGGEQRAWEACEARLAEAREAGASAAEALLMGAAAGRVRERAELQAALAAVRHGREAEQGRGCVHCASARRRWAPWQRQSVLRRRHLPTSYWLLCAVNFMRREGEDG